MTIEHNSSLFIRPAIRMLQIFRQLPERSRVAPDIEVYIASNNISSSVTRRHAGRRPALVFSPGNLLTFVRCGAKFMPAPRYRSWSRSRIQAAGLPVPASRRNHSRILICRR